nr:hypothetical protein [Tanacetum cinerariifolium]
MVPFIKEFRYTSKYDMLSEIHTDQMHQPLRTFAAVINRCISRKSTGLDRLGPSKAQILWGVFNQKNVDYVALMWEYVMFQADNREISFARKENMPYLIFTKVIINHFISKDKTIFMRNMINLYTVREDSLLGTLKFVSKTQDYQKYGALITEEIINQAIKDSKAYKIYLDFATRKSAPKKKGCSRKLLHPQRNCVVIKDTPGVFVSKKKAPTKRDSGDDYSNDDDGDDLSNDDDDDDVDSNADGDNKASDSETTSSYEDENPNLNQNDDEKEEYVCTLENYEFTNDVEEYEELYKDVNVKLKDAGHEKEGKGDVEMTDASRDDKTKGLMQSSTISFEFSSQFLNLDNVPLAGNEFISMMNFKARHEEPSTQTPSLLTVLVTVIPETSTAAALTIPLTIPQITPLPQQSTPTLTYTVEFEKKAQAEKDRYIDLIDENQGQDMGKTDDQPMVMAASKQDLFKNPQRPMTPNLIGMLENLLILGHLKSDQQNCSSRKTSSFFDELMSTAIDFLAYVMQNLKIDLTQEHLVGPTFNLLKGTCRSRVELEYHFKECYKAATNRVDWNNLEGQEYPFNLSNPLPLIEVQGRQVILLTTSSSTTSSYLEEIEVPREDPKLYKFKECDFPRLNLHDIEDMLLLLVQKKIFNLERDVIFDLSVALQMFTRHLVILKRVEDLQLGVKSYQKKLNITKPETIRSGISKRTPYTAYNNPQGIIYVDKCKQNRLMGNLEKFVGKRDNEEDFRLLELTI